MQSRMVAVISAALLMLASGLRAQAPAPAPDAEAQKKAMEERREAERAKAAAIRETQGKIDTAVKQLVAEAKDIGNIGKEQAKPVWSRPHPGLKGLGPDDALPVLNRMAISETDNPYMDTYVRWHLMAVVTKARQSDRDEAGRRVVALIKKVPDELKVEGRREYVDEPADIAAEWHRLYYSLRRQVGYPPFEQLVNPPESLAHMNPAERAEGERTWARAQELRKQWTRVVDKDAVAFNDRVRRVQQMLREYRGELIYELLKTADPAMLDLVLSEISRQAQAKTGIQFDLLNYMYLAGFDGFLTLYSKDALKKAAVTLERIGRAHDVYVEFGRLKRNFADYCYHMVYMLQDPEGFLDLRDATIAERPKRQAKSQQSFTGATLTAEQIQEGISRAVDALYTNPNLQPTYTPLPYWVYQRHRLHVPFELRHMMGNHALIGWALLACGESYQNPLLYKRLNWVLSSDAPLTYDRSMRMQMLAQMPRERWAPWVRRDGIWLTAALGQKGNYDEEWFGKDITGFGDNANGQYGVLGLWGAERNSYPVSAKVWAMIDQYWRAAQAKTKSEDEPAGWAVFSAEMRDSRETQGVGFYRRVSGPMTAGGVATLCLTERYLRGPKMLNSGEQHVSLELRKGIRWLDQNFRLDDKGEESDQFYYYWTMQRVGHATGYKSFNGVDLFRDITARMLSEQRPDGTWVGDKGQLLSTGFALLYLSRAYDPLAVGKVRWQERKDGKVVPGPWNHRPHDCWNFVDYVSDQYECATTWQIVELDLGVYSLIEAPMLYLATDSGFSFNEKQLANLKEYLDAGGTLLINPDRINPDLTRSVQELATKLYPDLKWKDVPRDHGFYTIHQTLRQPMPMKMLDNGIRPVIVQFMRDIGEGLQANDVATSDSFKIMSNIYLYVTGMNPRRLRLVNNYVPVLSQNPGRKLTAVRLRHNGQYDPEPGALAQLANLLTDRKWSIDLKVETLPGKQLSHQDIAFLTTTGDGELSDEDIQGIRQWLNGTGVLWIDAAGGSTAAAKNAEAMLRKISPDGVLAPLSFEHPVLSGDGLPAGEDVRYARYRNFALKSMGPLNRPKLQGVEINGRVAILFSTEDITCGMAGLDHWGIFGYLPRTARAMAVNSVLMAGKIR